MKTLTNVFIGLTIFAVTLSWVKFTDARDVKLMTIEYCWDNSGKHYEAPNTNCTH